MCKVCMVCLDVVLPTILSGKYYYLHIADGDVEADREWLAKAGREVH